MVTVTLAINAFLRQRDQGFFSLNDVDFSLVTEESMQSLIDFLSSHKAIQVIYMERCNLSRLSEKNARLLFEQFGTTNIVTLKLASNELGSNDIILNCLAALVITKKIDVLDLSGNNIGNAGESGVNALCSIISEGKIKELLLGENALTKIPTRLLPNLFAAIERSSHLESLDLAFNDLGLLSPELLTGLANSILLNKSLKRLNIGTNKLLELETNTSLVKVFLDKLLGKKLDALGIADNYLASLGTEWVLSFIERVIHSEYPKSVNMSANSFVSLIDEDSDFIRKLALVIGSQDNLRRIVIKNNGLLSPHEKLLAATFLATQALETLHKDVSLLEEFQANPELLLSALKIAQIFSHKPLLLEDLLANREAIATMQKMLATHPIERMECNT